VYIPFPRENDMPTANAAYLSRVKSIGLEAFNVEFKGPGLADIEEFTSLPPLANESDINSYMGKPIHTGLEARASFIAPNVGLSGFSNYSLRTYLSNPLVPEWYVQYFNDYGFTLAIAKEIMTDLSAGIAIKRVQRTGGETTFGFDKIQDYISTQDSNVILGELDDSGLGYGIDLSLLYRKSDSDSSPIATVVWKDVGMTTFQAGAGENNPPPLRDNLALGLGYLWDGPGMDLKAGFEYRHILTTKVQIGKKLHMGVEFSLPLVDIRAGMSQGYMTYGVGLDLWVFRFEAAQFTEEFGVYPGQTPESRVQVSLTLDLTVDANFDFSSKSRNRVKLKQRR
ncbi:MAG: hypothetical protein ACK5V3_03575, partial [Bdellovibrionales bacterium]